MEQENSVTECSCSSITTDLNNTTNMESKTNAFDLPISLHIIISSLLVITIIIRKIKSKS